MQGELSSPDLHGVHVLVVEDEYFIADDVRHALTTLGATVVGPAPTLPQAEKLLSEGPAVDIAILDINLRGEMVYPLAGVLRARNIPFVFVTGYGVASIPAAYQDVARWEKPFDLRALAQLLPTLLPS